MSTSEVTWADGIYALRRAGFVCAAESPAAVMLVSPRCSILLARVRILDEMTMRIVLRATRLAEGEFLALLPQ